MTIKLNLCLGILSAIAITFASCKKEAGEGGTSTITGKIKKTNYNSNFSAIYGNYVAADQDVYIIYGNELSFGERSRTSYDGTYVFKFLRPGKYKIYAYSRDTTGLYQNKPNTNLPDVAVVKETEITKEKQRVDVNDIVIID